jgi:hypothetical protein
MSEQDWKARAEREAAAMLAGVGIGHGAAYDYPYMVRLCSAAWLLGVNLGEHRKLNAVEQAIERVQAEL